MVKAQLWTRETASRPLRCCPRMMSIDTPHIPSLCSKKCSPPRSRHAAYLKSGAIRNASWRERRIDFQPYPYPSYTEELVRRLKDTLIEGNRAFLDALDPATAARELVDDRFVKAAVTAAGGMAAFGLPESFTRTEVVVG